MARKVKYDVESDLSGEVIPEGERVVLRFEYEAEGKKNYVADLTIAEADALVEHVHAREMATRNRTEKAGDEKKPADKK